MKRRLRLFDFRCPLFFIVLFYRRQSGEPIFELSIFDERRTVSKWWLYFWQWEDEPDKRPQFNVPPTIADHSTRDTITTS